MDSLALKIEVKVIGGSDSLIADLARTTVKVEHGESDRTINPEFIHRMYLSEHSPIRSKNFLISIKNIPSWIATHLTRHHIGYTPYVSTQREDRVKGIDDRDSQPQGALVNMDILLNSQAFISVSRKRLCSQAHHRTREVWSRIISALHEVDKGLAECCVADCIYRGYCYEMNTCGYHKTKGFKMELEQYRRLVSKEDKDNG